MPELPEVETVRIGLQRLLPGKIIASLTYDWDKSFPNDAAVAKQFLMGATVLQVRRRAKVLLLDLSTKYTLVIHLKMTGQLVFRGEQSFGAGHPNNSLVGTLPDKSTRVIFGFLRKDIVLEPDARKSRSSEESVHMVQRSNTEAADTAEGQGRWQGFGLCREAGQCDSYLYFNDQRKFGWVRLLPTVEVEKLDFFKKVGPEPLAAEFTWPSFRDRLRRRSKTSIKAALLDQTVVAGVGNIYADESLWGAKVHPTTLVGSLSDKAFQKLFTALQDVLRLSIEKGGSTDKNYVDAEGKKGSYLTFANVFRRENQPCPRCGTTIIKTRVAGRGTHLCPKCQKP